MFIHVFLMIYWCTNLAWFCELEITHSSLSIQIMHL